MAQTSALRVWVTDRAIHRLEEGWTVPDIADELNGECPSRLISDATRPQIARLIGEIAKSAGYVIISEGVNVPGPTKQLELISRDELLTILRKRRDQRDNFDDATMALVTAWCDAHPEEAATPAELIAKAS
jgi:hypothetical protein